MAEQEIVEEVIDDIPVEAVISDQPEGLGEEDLGKLYDDIASRDDEPEDAPERGPDGKFKAKDAEAAPDEAAPAEGIDVSGTAVIGEEPEKATPSIDAPATWTETARSKWAALDPEVQQVLLEQETARTQIDQQKDQWFREIEPIVRALEPATQQIRLSGSNPASYVQSMVAHDQMMRTNPQEGLKAIARLYGVSLPTPDENGYDGFEPSPDMSPVLTEVDQLKTQINRLIQEQEQAKTQALSTDIAKFAADKPHFEKVRANMGALIDAGIATDLATAYDKAVLLDPELRPSAPVAEIIPIKTNEDAARKAAEAKRRIAATNLSSSGMTGGNSVPFESEEDELGAVFDRMQGS